MVRSTMKTLARKAEAAIAAGDAEVAPKAVRVTVSNLDRAAKKGVIHANAAARRKSRLMSKYNAALAAAGAPPSETEKPKTRRTKATRPTKARKAKKAEKQS